MPNTTLHRRNFLRLLGLSTAPVLLPATGLSKEFQPPPTKADDFVDFRFDGIFYSPTEYLQKLAAFDALEPIAPDIYGSGGATRELEQAFARLTGKEKALFMPTGTMANQLAIKMLNRDNTKVIVPENSHVFRDEADAAQAVHNKRLIPVGKGKPFFDLADLKESIAYYQKGEVFKSGLGTIVIENPVRRADGAAVALETIKEISGYCRKQGYRTHLDGARLHIAAAYTGVSVKEYASYFDTVYISLYKYLGAAGGAILCGDAAVIDKMVHQIKVLGGASFRTWQQSAMALYFLDGIEERWEKTVVAAGRLIARLRKMDGLDIREVSNGTNKYFLRLDKQIDPVRFRDELFNKHKIILFRYPRSGQPLSFTINETLIRRNISQVISAFAAALNASRK